MPDLIDGPEIKRGRICSPFTLKRLERGRMAALTEPDSELVPLSQEEALILTECRQCRKASDYLEYRRSAHLRRRNGELSASSSGEMLVRSLIERGLLVDENDLIARFASSGDSVAPPISSLGIITRNRESRLRNCLGVCLKELQRLGHPLRIVICNGSPKWESEAATKAAAAAVKPHGQCNIAYAGHQRKDSLAREICSQTHVSSEVVSFALNGLEGWECLTGANRNLFLLETAGELAFMMDDDVDIITRSADREMGIRFESSATDARQMSFFEDRRSALSSLHSVDIDFLAEHECLLGKSIQRCISNCGGPTLAECATIDDEFFRMAVTPAHVAITINGLAGDSGMNSSSSLLWSQGKSRVELTRNLQAYLRACKCREVTRTVSRAVVSNTRFCMTTFLGIDNRRLLPPFVPIGRGQDGLFGLTLGLCNPRSFTGFVPVTLDHSPSVDRAFERSWIRRPSQSLSSLLAMLVRSVNTGTAQAHPTRRLERLGCVLREIAELDEEDGTTIKERLAEAVALDLQRIEELMGGYDGKPIFWLVDAVEYTRAMESRLRTGCLVAPDDMPLEGCQENIPRAFRRILHLFGRLLEAWPTILNAAVYLKERERIPG